MRIGGAIEIFSEKCRQFVYFAPAMIVSFSTQHDMIDLMGEFGPGKGDPMQYARSIRPNTFAAEDEFLEVWQERAFDAVEVERLHITLFFQHSKADRPQPSQKLTRTKEGYSCAVFLSPDDLIKNGIEKRQSEIGECLENRVNKIIERVKNL